VVAGVTSGSASITASAGGMNGAPSQLASGGLAGNRDGKPGSCGPAGRRNLLLVATVHDLAGATWRTNHCLVELQLRRGHGNKRRAGEWCYD
jgi:hypothetical protein